MIEKLVLKYFGDGKKLQDVLEKAKIGGQGKIQFDLSEKYGDYKVEISYLPQDKKEISPQIRYIISTLQEGIYAEFDTTLSQRLFDWLKLKNKKISVAESFTGGRVVSSIINNPGASSSVMEGIVAYSNQSKIDRLSVRAMSIFKEGAVSSAVACEMALGLLSTGNCDIAVSTTGLAGPKSDDSDLPVGLCYIGIGTKSGIHTYKFNFTGDREQITETGKNTALFLAIKKLKEI